MRWKTGRDRWNANSLWLLVVLGLIVVLCVATGLFDGTLVERMSFPLG